MISVLQDLCKVGDMNHFITQGEVCSRREETDRKQRMGWRGHIQSQPSGLRGDLSQEAAMNGSEGTPSAKGQTSGSR